MATYNFYPVSVNETYWEINSYQTRTTTVGQKTDQAYTSNSLRDVLYEDLSTMEGCQRGLDAGVLKAILISDMEISVRHQYWAVEQWVNAGSLA